MESKKRNVMNDNWRFWIDKGGTFTDIISISPTNKINSIKILSNDPTSYEDSIVEGIKNTLQINEIKNELSFSEIRIGTTLATNALLEKKGSKVLLCVTKGFKDSLYIGTQQRSNIFSRNYKRENSLYKKVIEIEERLSSKGKNLIDFNEKLSKKDLHEAFEEGYDCIAILLMHSYRYNKNEKKLFNIAKKIGFKNISLSHECCPIMNFINRGFTTVADAYLNPIIQNYTDYLKNNLKPKELFFMKSSGSLSDYKYFRGKDSFLSGPAGGVIAGATIAKAENENNIIGFDMGGTSTDVWQYSGKYDLVNKIKISGIHLSSPALNIETVASGGGSILKTEFGRFVLGPESAGASPGPACYRNNGPLTLTDCNVVLGRIIPDNFPKLFGKNKNLSISKTTSIKGFRRFSNSFSKEIKTKLSIEDIASDYLKIAIENMANAIKKISVQKGYNIKEYSLLSFGSAGGQHACLVADSINIKKILVSPFSGVLSALGIGLAKHGIIIKRPIEKELSLKNIIYSKHLIKIEESKALKEIFAVKKNLKVSKISENLSLKYSNTSTVISIAKDSFSNIKKNFIKEHIRLFGFNVKNKKIIIESIEEEIQFNYIKNKEINLTNYQYDFLYIKKNQEYNMVYMEGVWKKIKVFDLRDLKYKKLLNGPCLFFDKDNTIIIEKNWSMKLSKIGNYILEKKRSLNYQKKYDPRYNLDKPNPAMLEIFNNLFMSIAEQMGEVIKKTAQSINIKERLDFSCALFNFEGSLVANAPHIPIHLGAMGETVKFIIQKNKLSFRKGHNYIHNDPYSGGTHLPDITIITPIFLKNNKKPSFFVASRAHHADIGGSTPGSMPAFSKTIFEEGILFNSFLITKKGKFLEKKLRAQLLENLYPVRNIEQNISDIKAQIASSERAKKEIKIMVETYGLKTIRAYMKFSQEESSDAIKNIIKNIPDSQYSLKLDNNSIIKVIIKKQLLDNTMLIDFSGSSAQLSDNFNAPLAITKSSVLYVLRTLINKDIPLNEGCMIPIDLIVPKSSMLNPDYPAAVVAGNVETSQSIVDLLNAALNVQAACYGTMNNITFGNNNFGYYETICGGEGASYGSNGADAVQCHMTNTSLTDPEVLEWFYPVLLNYFEVRKGSGGLGKWNGGNGTKRKITFLKKLNLIILSNRRKTSPFGIEGGGSGQLGKNIVKRKNGTVELLKYADETIMAVNDALILETPGGGAYGIKKD